MPSDLLAEINSLWAIANARRDAQESPRRHIALAYSMMPGDSEISARAWLDEAESDRLHALTLSLPSPDDEAIAAHQRILAKIKLRKVTL